MTFQNTHMQKLPFIKEKCIKQSHEPIYCLCLIRMINAKSLKQILVIKETRSWLPPWLDGQSISNLYLTVLKLV